MTEPSPPEGSSPHANWLRRLWEYCRANRVLQGTGYFVKRTSIGTILEIQPGTGGTGAATYHLKQVLDDSLRCRSWDGITEGATDVYVAKPYRLRISLLTLTEMGTVYNFTYQANAGDAAGNNKFRTKTPAGGGGAEQQLVSPVWVVDEEITAVPCQTTVTDPNGKPIMLMLVDSLRNWGKQ